MRANVNGLSCEVVMSFLLSLLCAAPLVPASSGERSLPFQSMLAAVDFHTNLNA